MPISLYDVAMLIVLAAATLWGLWKGMAWQVASLASILVGAAVAVHSSPAFAPLLVRWFNAQKPWNRYLAMLVLYLVTAAAIWILFHLVSNVIDRVQLKEFDRQIGAFFGLAKGILYCMVVTFFAVTLWEPTRLLVLQSRSGDLIARGIRDAYPVLPEDIRAYLGKYIDEFDAKLHAPPVAAAPGTGVAPAVSPTPATSASPPPTAGQNGDNGDSVTPKKSLKDRLLGR